ncbi:hypothetical protein FD755_017770, partial [Muntiacus reevesi]
KDSLLGSIPAPSTNKLSSSHFLVILQVYGTTFHINQGNPFKLKALVDKWPDFNTVVIRPQEQEMTDDLDHYTNTYQVYSKDPKKCQEFLGSPEVINWKQHLQIQSRYDLVTEQQQKFMVYSRIDDMGAELPFCLTSMVSVYHTYGGGI